MATSTSRRSVGFSCILLLFLSAVTQGGAQEAGKLYPRFQGSFLKWIDHAGFFLHSPSSNFAFRFHPKYEDKSSCFLVIIHSSTITIIWSVNPDNPVSCFDMFVFGKDGCHVAFQIYPDAYAGWNALHSCRRMRSEFGP